MSESIIKYAKYEDLKELYAVYTSIFNDTLMTFEKLEKYFFSIPESIIIGTVDNKIVSHIFSHPINNINYEECNYWSDEKYYDSNGKYLFLWGVGILKEYRTIYNISSFGACISIKLNIEKYNNIEKTITVVLNSNKKMQRPHMILGYDVKYVLNGKTDHALVLEFDVKDHILKYGYDRIKRVYGYINNGNNPKFIN